MTEWFLSLSRGTQMFLFLLPFIIGGLLGLHIGINNYHKYWGRFKKKKKEDDSFS